jgi:hypothetical protein
MEALLLMLILVLGVALAAAVGTYYVSHSQLVKAHSSNPEFLSLFLSLCTFGLVMVVVYFVFLDNIISKW